MKITNTKHINRKKHLIIAAAILLLAAGGVTVYALTRSSSDGANNTEQQNDAPRENEQNLDKATDDQVEAGNKAKEDFIDKTDNTAPEVSAARVSITSVQQNQGVLGVRSMVESSQAVGQCSVTLERTGQSKVEQTAELQSMGSYSACKGFDIAVADLAKGEWRVTVAYTNGTSRSTDSRMVTIQ